MASKSVQARASRGLRMRRRSVARVVFISRKAYPTRNPEGIGEARGVRAPFAKDVGQAAVSRLTHAGSLVGLLRCEGHGGTRPLRRGHSLEKQEWHRSYASCVARRGR